MKKYKVLLGYARPHRAMFVRISVVTLASSALTAAQPWPMKWLVDHVLGQKPVSAYVEKLFSIFSLNVTANTLLAAVVALGLGFFALGSVAEVALTRAWTIAGRRLVYDLSEKLFGLLQRRPLVYHSRTAVGDTMGRITGDAWCVHKLVDTLIFTPSHALLTMAAMLVLMAQLDTTLTLVALGAAPLMVLASFVFGKPVRLAAKRTREIEVKTQSHLQQTLTGIPIVQAFTQEQRELERFERFADAAIAAQQRKVIIGSFSSLSSGLVSTLGTGLILWIGARNVLAGALSLGSLLVFLAYLSTLQSQFKALAQIYTAVQGLNASIDRVFEVLHTPPEIPEGARAVTIARGGGHVALENVTVGYERDKPVLRGVSLRAEPGQTVALVGGTGAGKTTLVNLIPRFLDPWEGRVRLDGHDIRGATLKSLREHVAIVMQEPFLFPVTVAENIAFGRPGASLTQIEHAARAANAHLFIKALPDGYDTILGERGGTLSGGERQRLSIARALLKNAPILILDEPTSALDSETERSLLDAIDRLMKGRTTFIIAHRLSTIRRADNIIVLRNGSVAEEGTHSELIARGEFYARSHIIQFSRDSRTAVTTA